MVGITVGRSTKTNTLSVYVPSANQYYEPDSYSLDLSCRPSIKFSTQIYYNGGLHTHL